MNVYKVDLSVLLLEFIADIEIAILVFNEIMFIFKEICILQDLVKLVKVWYFKKVIDFIISIKDYIELHSIEWILDL